MARRRRNNGYGRQEADADGWFGGMDMVLRINGIKGDCDLPGLEGWIPILAWSWGASKDVQPATLPIRVRQAKVEKRRLALEAVGLDENGNPLKKDEDDDEEEAPVAASAEPADSSSGYGRRGRRGRYGRRNRTPAAPTSTTSLLVEKALAALELDSELEFSDSEIAPQPKARPNTQDLSCTKYCDIATADIMALVLGQHKGVEMELRVCKSRLKKLTDAEIAAKAEAKAARVAAKAAAAAAAAAPAEERKSSDDKGSDDEAEPAAAAAEEEEDEPEREYVAIQQFVLFDAFVTSVSTGGSGGEDRLTENITLSFGSFQYKFVDWQGPRPVGSKQPPAEKSIIYDGVRNSVKPYTEVVKKEINKSDQLAPCSSIIMSYL